MGDRMRSVRRQLPVGKFVVVCRRFDGREREWQSYSDRDDAERVAQHLTSIGCPSRVRTDDEPEGRAR